MKPIIQEMDHPVYVITSKIGDRHYGCVITWLMKASLHPHETKIAFVMSPHNDTFKALTDSKKFVLNRLSPKQVNEFFILGTAHSDESDKFQSFPFEERAEGLILKEASGFAVGEIVDALKTPDRHIFYASLSEQQDYRPDSLKLGDALARLLPSQKEALTSKMQHDAKRDEKQFTPS